ncbi:PaaX family transcriptional regulator C-terminal domain-containing protein, partial [Stenotrophomonas sp. Betaine-02u-23]|uniref:PaaX family transcriptional regulator C-terminal domain-containing protein n=1 Tax=Stenotrophomonas sp. Betaine-02u-23 TaxID=2058302 RepID=UPI001E4EA81D
RGARQMCRSDRLHAAMAVRAGKLFGISANSTRVALTRLLSAGMVEAVGRGAYRLGRPGRALSQDISSWREAESRVREWKGGWVAAVTSGLPRSDRGLRRTRERAFVLLGLRPLEAGLFVRPDNLAGGAAEVRQRLHALGVERAAPVFLAADLDAAREARARRLWKGRALEKSYRDTRKALEASLQRLPALSVEDAARQSYLVGDAALRVLVFDPLLPEPLVSTAERRAFVEAMRRYDEAGQLAWRRLLSIPD